MSMTQSRPILNRLRKEAPDSSHRKKPGKRNGRTLEKVENYPVGHISFLQESFGKLRTVANPNRFVQWQLTPLGETLSQWVNHLPGVYVLSQEEGISWIQEQLKSGVHLTSADLSSASDTLDYVQVLDILNEPDIAPELSKHIEYFKHCSAMPWYISDPHAREYVGQDTIRWKQGQPLGLRPSFPVLTLCNWWAATLAVYHVEGEVPTERPFAIVGDDIVIHTKYAKAYSDIISAMGGVANLDKSMSSDKQAEFCSRLITSDTVTRLKARYLPDNAAQNILTYQGRGIHPKVPHWAQRAAARVGAMALVESGVIPPFNPDQPAPFREKVLFHAALALDKGEKTTHVEKTLNSMWYAYLEQGEHPFGERRTVNRPPDKVRKGLRKAARRLFSKPRPPLSEATELDRYRKFLEWNPGIDKSEFYYKVMGVRMDHPSTFEISDALHHLEKAPQLYSRVPDVRWIQSDSTSQSFQSLREASAREQRVETVRREYDHHTDSHALVQHPDKTLKSLDRKVQRARDGFISDTSGEALIQRVSPGVERLIERDGKGLYVSYHTKKSSSPRRRVLREDVPVVAECSQDDYEFDL